MTLPVSYPAYGIIYNSSDSAVSGATVKITDDTSDQGTLILTTDGNGKYFGDLQNYASDGHIIRVHAAYNGEVEDITYTLNLGDIPHQEDLTLDDIETVSYTHLRAHET